MKNKNNAFPWGSHIGDLIYNNNTIPLCINSKDGGFCITFDSQSESMANNLIENVALNFLDILPIRDVVVDIFDYSHKKRFMHLSYLQSEKLYDIAFSQNSAIHKFNKLEEIALDRHHNILTFNTPTISEYNQINKFKEQYHLLLINLNSFPDDTISAKRIKNFFDSAYEAGFYIICFGSNSLINSDAKIANMILNQFPTMHIEKQKIELSKEIFDFGASTKKYTLNPINENKNAIVKNLLQQLEDNNSESKETDFLSIPIGLSKNGRDTINFTMGDKSTNLHAFITGVTGSGKTTLLNNIILGIAEKYTSEEIQLYLMDYKDGVEFQVFKNHPNCKKIFLDNEDTEASISLLKQFKNIILERALLFKEAEVNNIIAYNKLDSRKRLPRIVLVIDEVHKLFVGDYHYVNKFSSILKTIMRQGRSYGLHIILSTQSLAGTQIDRELMGQIMLRISYKLTNPIDSEAIFSYGNTEALNLNKYELIYNNNAGNKKDNVLCRVNPPMEIKNKIDNILRIRNRNLILKPTIVRSEIEEPVKSIQTIKFRNEIKQKNKEEETHNTTKEERILAQLEKQGIMAAY